MKRLLFSVLIATSPLLCFAQNYAPTPQNESLIQPPTQPDQSVQPAQQNQQIQQVQQVQQMQPAQQYQQAPQYPQAPPAQAVQVMPAPNVPVGDPGYYGQVDVVNNTVPPVIYTTPVVVQAAPPGVYYPPVYLRVPPMYYQNWSQYCGYYNACLYPVFFVQEGWYVNIYSPWYRRYYPYGRPGFVAHVYYNPHYAGYHGGPHYYEHGVYHEHRY